MSLFSFFLGARVHDEPCLASYNDCRSNAKSFSAVEAFYGLGCQPHAQPPTWRAKVSLFVWIITFDLSGMGDPTSSYATAGIALRITRPRKPHHYVKGEIPTGGFFFVSMENFLRYWNRVSGCEMCRSVLFC
jgi:hypothetical protein